MHSRKIAVIFGGQSSEHEVSCMSVQNVLANIDSGKYEIMLIGITKDGRWLRVDSADRIKDGTWTQSRESAFISPDRSYEGNPDVAFAVLHGSNGEDGTIQGLFELAGIPYVGCGVLSSAVTMDKYYTKIIVEKLNHIRQADYEVVFACDMEEKMDSYVKKTEEHLGYPVFIKPCIGGSSCGVSRADGREKLIAGLREAAKFDGKILVEEMIAGREVECAVLGGKTDARASGVGEILAAAEFYDYDAKYNDPQSRTTVDPDLPGEIVEEIRKDAVEIFKILDCYGLSRVDFFVKEDGTVVFNEINTIPGFTGISMYPMLWEAAGIDKKELMDRLIDLAFSRKR